MTASVCPASNIKMFKFATLAALVSLVPFVNSQAAEWGQCMYHFLSSNSDHVLIDTFRWWHWLE